MERIVPDHSLAASVARFYSKEATDTLAYVPPVDQVLSSSTEPPMVTVGDLALLLLVDLSVEVRCRLRSARTDDAQPH